VLTQLSKGGGAKGINIDDVTRQLEDLTREYPFQVLCNLRGATLLPSF
jgi:hypothetical protein